MCFLVRFGKYLSAPILSWLDVIAIVRLEIALPRSKLIGLIQEFANLFEASLFSSMESMKLSRGLVQWSNTHGLKGWGDVEVEVAPSLFQHGRHSAFKWFFGHQEDKSIQLIANDFLQSVKRVKVRPNTGLDVLGDLLKYLQSAESLTVNFMDSSHCQSIVGFQRLTSFTSLKPVNVNAMKVLCLLPNLTEVHLLSDCYAGHIKLLMTIPRLTALTVCGDESVRESVDSLRAEEVKCRLKSLRTNLFQYPNLTEFLTQGCGSALTLLNLQQKRSIPDSELRLISAHCSLLTNLTLPPRFEGEPLLSVLTLGWPHLTALNASNFASLTMSCLLDVSHCCPSLVRLSLLSAMPTLYAFPNLQYLALGTTYGLARSLEMCSLSQLKLFECFDLDVHTLFVLSSRCSGLESLRVGQHKWRDLSGSFLDELHGLCIRQPLLQELVIGSRICGIELIDIVRKCPRLVHLDVIIDDDTTTNRELKTMITLLTRLKFLYFASRVKLWKSEDLRTIACTCRRLESFYLRLKGHQLIPLSNSISEMYRLNPDLMVTIITVERF